MRILITDGNSRPALAATRSLGSRGHAVVVAADRRRSLAGISRHAELAVECPSPDARPDEFVDRIAALARSLGVEAILPMTEVSTLLLAGRRDALPSSCLLPLADVRTIEFASAKHQVVALALELGIPVPKSACAVSASDALSLLGQLEYPAVIKPGRSRVRTARGWLRTGVDYAQDAASARSLLLAIPEEAYPVLLQERISGDGYGLFACFDRGKPVAWFAHRRLREKPPWGGVSVLSESVPLDSRALEHSRRLLERLAWHGVAMVEFKRDDRDGQFRLMEINGRFWGSLQLAIDAGVDFPSILIGTGAGKDDAPAPPYRIGMRCRWLLGDLDALLASIFRGRRSELLPTHFPSRLRSLRDFLLSSGPLTRQEVLRRDDPLPGVLEWIRWMSRS